MSHRAARACVLGVYIDSIPQQGLEAEIERAIHAGDKQLLLNVNIHCLNLSYTNAWLRDFLNSAHLVYCDGYGPILAAFLLGYRIVGRTTFGDWIYSLCELAAQQSYKLYFLGSRPGVAELAASRLQDSYPGLRVVGTHHGYFDKSPDSNENTELIAEINVAQPDILFVCFGMPLQEKWLAENWDKLDARVGLAAGAMLDYASGTLKRPPPWMTNHGLEWLGRLMIEPRRLWRRYLLGIPILMWRIILQRLGLLQFDD